MAESAPDAAGTTSDVHARASPPPATRCRRLSLWVAALAAVVVVAMARVLMGGFGPLLCISGRCGGEGSQGASGTGTTVLPPSAAEAAHRSLPNGSTTPGAGAARPGLGGLEGARGSHSRPGIADVNSAGRGSGMDGHAATGVGAGERRLAELCNPVLSDGSHLPANRRCILYTLLGMGDAELSPVATCSFESAAVRHPNRPVVVVVYGWAVPHKERHPVLANLTNLHVVETTFRDSFAGVPALADWYASPAGRTITDLLGGVRLALVLKYGGVFLDADMIVRASLDGFTSTIGAQTGTFGRNGSPYRFHGGEINNAVLAFEPRAEFMQLACELFVKHYEAGVFGVQGPVLMGRVANVLRDKYNNTVPPEVMNIAEADVFNPVRAEARLPGARPRDQLMVVIASPEEFQRFLPYTYRPVPTAFHLYSLTLPPRVFSAKTVLGYALHEGCPETYTACVAAAPRPGDMCNLKSQFYAHTERSNGTRTQELMKALTRPGGEAR